MATQIENNINDIKSNRISSNVSPRRNVFYYSRFHFYKNDKALNHLPEIIHDRPCEINCLVWIK